MSLDEFDFLGESPIPFHAWKAWIRQRDEPIVHTRDWYYREYGRYVDGVRARHGKNFDLSKVENPVKNEFNEILEYLREDGYLPFGADGDREGLSTSQTVIKAMRHLAAMPSNDIVRNAERYRKLREYRVNPDAVLPCGEELDVYVDSLGTPEHNAQKAILQELFDYVRELSGIYDPEIAVQNFANERGIDLS